MAGVGLTTNELRHCRHTARLFVSPRNLLEDTVTLQTSMAGVELTANKLRHCRQCLIICLTEIFLPLTFLEHSDHQEFLEDFRDVAGSLESQIRDVANEAEDITERSMLEQIRPRFRRRIKVTAFPRTKIRIKWTALPPIKSIIKKKLRRVGGKIEVVVGKVMDTKNDAPTIKEAVQPSDSQISSGVNLNIKSGGMVGAEDDLLAIKNRVCGESRKLQIIPIFGMGGIGKTTLAKNVYDDPLLEHFDLRIWVTVSQDYSEKKVFSSLLNSMDLPNETNVGRMAERVYKHLKGRRYIIVVDDMWSTKVWDDLRSYFPDDGNGSRIILTTRLHDVASFPNPDGHVHEMCLMDENQSWNLLREKVFMQKDCPPELENIGREIAKRCKGLPLAIVVIAGLLSTVRRNRASWQEIAEHMKHADTAGHGQIEDILSLSYSHLPQYLRPCFLYMGSFPEDNKIKVTKLIRLWIAEGFVKHPKASGGLEKEAEECLEDLVKRSLVLVADRKTDGRIKSCSLHDLVRDMSIRKSFESKFFLNLLDKHFEDENFTESIKDHRRIGVDSFNLRQLSSVHGSTIRTIMCSHNYSVDLDFLEGVRLLRVLDADAADVESLPAQLFKLLHLRYLEVSHDNSIYGDLTKLKNLQTLIIDREEHPKFGRGVSCGMLLPWCMPQLRHVYFHDTIFLDDPTGTSCSLENLQTLCDLSHLCCTKKILKRVPNLKKLKIDCSSGGSGDETSLNNLVHLHNLENLEIYGGCEDEWDEERPNCFKLAFPEKLKKLSLKDLRLPWSDLAIVGSLPHLQVLKLGDGACTGSTWETSDEQFLELEYLLIEGWELEEWITESSHFPRLKSLVLQSCQSLEEIPNDIGEIPTLELIEVKYIAKKSLVESAKAIEQEQRDYGNETLQVLCINIESPLHERVKINPHFRMDEDEDDNGNYAKSSGNESPDSDEPKDEDDNDNHDKLSGNKSPDSNELEEERYDDDDDDDEDDEEDDILL